jgi:hypothetical protein
MENIYLPCKTPFHPSLTPCGVDERRMSFGFPDFLPLHRMTYVSDDAPVHDIPEGFLHQRCFQARFTSTSNGTTQFSPLSSDQKGAILNPNS